MAHKEKNRHTTRGNTSHLLIIRQHWHPIWLAVSWSCRETWTKLSKFNRTNTLQLNWARKLSGVKTFTYRFHRKERLQFTELDTRTRTHTAVDWTVYHLWHTDGFRNQSLFRTLLKISPHRSSFFALPLLLDAIRTLAWKLCLPEVPIEMLLPFITVVWVCCTYVQDESDLFSPGGMFLQPLAFHCLGK